MLSACFSRLWSRMGPWNDVNETNSHKQAKTLAFSASFTVPKLDFFKAEEWVLSRVDWPHFLLSVNLLVSRQSLLSTAPHPENLALPRGLCRPHHSFNDFLWRQWDLPRIIQISCHLLFKKKFKVIWWMYNYMWFLVCTAVETENSLRWTMWPDLWFGEHGHHNYSIDHMV